MKNSVIDLYKKNNNIEDNIFQKSLKSTLIVDAENGPCKSIQEAINKAEPNSIIKVAPGLYSDNLIINKGGLTIEPKEKLGDIILIVNSKPAITIDLKKNEKCTITGLKISHSGNSEDLERLEKILEEREIGLGNNTGNINQLLHSSPDNELVNKFPIDKYMNAIILLNGGKLAIEETLLSLSFIVKAIKFPLPALVCNEGTELVMTKCTIKGNKNYDTIGLLIKKADVIIKDCKIHSHLMGGILLWSNKNHTVKIINNTIIFNGKVGIHCVGEDGMPSIENNIIENNNGSGVKIGLANKAKIIVNQIKLNQDGIEVISAEPYIFNNIIDKNYSDGVVTKVFDSLRCDAKIKNNEISGNKENGVNCEGENNFSRIENNKFIGYNKKAGVRADNMASILIFKNNISKNLAQGILLVETSNAFIEQNKISENIKANIAFGGSQSVNTIILENDIVSGRCEGIFIIEGGQGWIIRNRIIENNDGIVAITSIPFINKNKIEKNKSNGIMLIKDSRPKITNNLIQENDGIGLFIRDKSNGEIHDNNIKNNEIELVVERKQYQLQNITKDNIIIGDIRIPQNLECLIF